MRLRAWWPAASLLAAAAIANDSAAQSIQSRVNAVRDGIVEMHFAPRPGVCTDGRGSMWIRDNGYNSVCITGPVRVTLSRSGGETVTIRKCIACRPRELARGDVDLGEVSPADAAKYLLDVAHQSGSTRNSDEAMSAALFGDAGDLSPELTRIVRDTHAPRETRRQAVFWLSQSDDPATTLIDIAKHDGDGEIRKAAMFWLGQSHDPKALQFFRDVLSP